MNAVGDVLSLEAKTVVVHTRLKPSQYRLLDHISQFTKLKKSSLVRAAVTQWLQNTPENLPLDLKVEITRANMQHTIETVKNLRWTYHQARQAHVYLKGMDKEPYLPPHTQRTIEKLEQQIITMQNQLDAWLKQQHMDGRP